MPSIQAIGREMEAEARREVAQKAVDFRPRFWTSWFSALTLLLLGSLPVIGKRYSERNGRFLSLVREYASLILEQYKEYETQFRMWEYENLSSGFCGTADTLMKERVAKGEAKRLTAELQKKLNEAGWCYRPLATFNDLVNTYPGYLRMDAVYRYWPELEAFLNARVGK